MLLLLLGPTGCQVGSDERADPADASSSVAREASPADAPPGTDIWLGELHEQGDSVVVTALRNVTARAGYDNQPTFLPDGSGFLYTAVDSTGQADTWRYELGADRSVRVTATRPESEYSPTPLPWGDGFSVVRVEADSTQRLWRFGWDGGAPTVLFPDVEPVGYHAWAGEEWVALFVLGAPPTLQIAGGETTRVREVARNVGRSIQTLPEGDAVSFVQIVADEGSATDSAAPPDEPPSESTGPSTRTRTRIMRWSARGGVTSITATPQGGDFHAWTPSGLLLMGDGDVLVAWKEGWNRWRTLGTVPAGSVSRLAVSPDGRRIAVVVESPDGG